MHNGRTPSQASKVCEVFLERVLGMVGCLISVDYEEDVVPKDRIEVSTPALHRRGIGIDLFTMK